ncbi:MAG: DUF6588 family protein [Candidatus Eisenbacteria bacterium]
MVARTRSLAALGCALLVVFAAVPVSAQIQEQIFAYTGVNAEGYLEPLALAIGANLNSALFHSAYIPLDGVHISLETPIMGVIFNDEDGTFMASVEGGFEPLDPGDTEVEASTVIGPGQAVVVDGVAGTAFAFPGGFSLNSFALAVPQLRVGSVRGTEALIRYIAIDAGDVEVGQLNLWGIGVRHNVSQYLGPDAPVDLAAGFMYQKFELGDELIDATAFTFGAQVSKRFPSGFAVIEPYAGLSYDFFQMDVSYTDGDDETVALSFDSHSTAHMTVGLHAQAAYVSLYGEYSLATQSGFAFGLSFGF